VPPDHEVYLSALDLMETHSVQSIFDAIYAATALSPRAKDNTIVSTDEVFAAIEGVHRVDPRDLSL